MKKPQLEESWLQVLQNEFQKEYMQNLRSFLVSEKKRYTVYPSGSHIFNAFNTTPFHSVRVVILGQDPYHGPGQAHGLSFSVLPNVSKPPSLKNIHQELSHDLQIPIPPNGDLSHWAQQGVLLLNTVLTVRHRSANSHRGKGWERFTDAAIQQLNEHHTGLIFVLWGRQAQAKKALIDTQKHNIIQSAHPSPYSADRGFFGSRPFSRINRYLEEQGLPPIRW